MNKTVIIFLVTVISFSFVIPEKVEKKADKIIAKFYGIEDFKKQNISIPENIEKQTPSQFSDKNLFKIISEKKLLGYGYIGSATSKTDTFDYLVIFDKDLIIVTSKVLVYREDYGSEIGSKRWLKQFIGKSILTKELQYQKNIVAISGATISARSMTKAINNVLVSLKLLQKNNIL